jgi:hypothetical protein
MHAGPSGHDGQDEREAAAEGEQVLRDAVRGDIEGVEEAAHCLRGFHRFPSGREAEQVHEDTSIGKPVGILVSPVIV